MIPTSTPSPTTPGAETTAGAVSDRQRWMGILARSNAAAIEDRLATVPDAAIPSYREIRAPETGMVMVQGRAGGTGTRFNMGEMTVTRCSVALEDGAVGHAYVAGRDPHHARLAALVDAALQTPAGRRLMTDVIEPLAATQSARRDRRAREAGATKVEFFTMVRGED